MKEQIKQHFVAILSLLIAVVALGYTSWREEATEHNRNTRQASFEVLKHLGELQVIVNQTIYQNAQDAFLGWGHVAIISDMGSLLPNPIPKKAEELAVVWGENWQKLAHDEQAQDAVTGQIDSLRESVRLVIHDLR